VRNALVPACSGMWVPIWVPRCHRQNSLTNAVSCAAVLASANPVGSRYNPQLSVVENIQLPPSLMSRFDLIYLVGTLSTVNILRRNCSCEHGAAVLACWGPTRVTCHLIRHRAMQLLDKANEATDRKLARHLVSLYGNGVGRLGNEVCAGEAGRPGCRSAFSQKQLNTDKTGRHICRATIQQSIRRCAGRHYPDGDATRLHCLLAGHMFSHTAARVCSGEGASCLLGTTTWLFAEP
jgi:hypothetical protein